MASLPCSLILVFPHSAFLLLQEGDGISFWVRVCLCVCVCLPVSSGCLSVCLCGFSVCLSVCIPFFVFPTFVFLIVCLFVSSVCFLVLNLVYVYLFLFCFFLSVYCSVFSFSLRLFTKGNKEKKITPPSYSIKCLLYILHIFPLSLSVPLCPPHKDISITYLHSSIPSSITVILNYTSPPITLIPHDVCTPSY